MHKIPESEYAIIVKETDAAIQKGYDSSKAEWRIKVLEIIYDTCMGMEKFTVNDFRKAVQESGLETHDNRAMGGVMVTAKSYGWIGLTGESIPSRVGHKSRLQIWKSLIMDRNRQSK